MTGRLPTNFGFGGPELRVPIGEDLQELRGRWFWILILGFALVALGMLAIVFSCTASLATILAFGTLIFVAGLVEVVTAFWAGSWGGFFVTLLTGVLSVIVGFIMINHQTEALFVYTLILAVAFMAQGLFRIIAALATRFHSWVWVLISGVVTLILGILIWKQLPSSAVWLIGTIIGIEMIFYGWSFISLALGLRSISGMRPEVKL